MEFSPPSLTGFEDVVAVDVELEFEGAVALDVVIVEVVVTGCRFGDRIWALSRSLSLPGRKESKSCSTRSSVGPHFWYPESFCNQTIMVPLTDRMLTSDLKQIIWRLIGVLKTNDSKLKLTFACNVETRVYNRAHELALQFVFASTLRLPTWAMLGEADLSTQEGRQWKIRVPHCHLRVARSGQLLHPSVLHKKVGWLRKSHIMAWNRELGWK